MIHNLPTKPSSTYILHKPEVTVDVVRFTSVQSFDSHVDELNINKSNMKVFLPRM